MQIHQIVLKHRENDYRGFSLKVMNGCGDGLGEFLSCLNSFDCKKVSSKEVEVCRMVFDSVKGVSI